VRTGPSPGRMAWPLAAGVLVGIGLAAFAKMTLFPQRQASQGFSGPEATAGPMLVLPPLVRSSGETVTAPLHRDSGFVVVACPARIPEDASPEQSFVYVLHAADGDDKAIWSQVMSARSIREHLGSPAASVILLVPAASLRPGRYEFALGREGSGEEPVYRVDVELTGAR